MHALIVTYALDGASSSEHAELREQLEPAFAAFPGIVSETRLTNEATGLHGAFFVLESRSAFERFVASELFETLRSHRNVRDVVTTDFAIERRQATAAGRSD